jgi:hypothetical protein
MYSRNFHVAVAVAQRVVRAIVRGLREVWPHVLAGARRSGGRSRNRLLLEAYRIFWQQGPRALALAGAGADSASCLVPGVRHQTA